MREVRVVVFFFLMIRRPPRSTLDRSSAASDVYKRQDKGSPKPNKDKVGSKLPMAKIEEIAKKKLGDMNTCLLYTSPSPRDRTRSRMPSSA